MKPVVIRVIACRATTCAREDTGPEEHSPGDAGQREAQASQNQTPHGDRRRESPVAAVPATASDNLARGVFSGSQFSLDQTHGPWTQVPLCREAQWELQVLRPYLDLVLHTIPHPGVRPTVVSRCLTQPG